MGRRVLPAVLVVVAALSDSAGDHGLARNALLAALPFAAVGALVTFGDYLDSRESLLGLQALCSGGIVLLLVISCASRSSAVHGTPQLAISSLVGVLALLGLKLSLGTAPFLRKLGRLTPAKP